MNSTGGRNGAKNMIAGGYRGRVNGSPRLAEMPAQVDRIRNQRLADLRAVRRHALAEEIDQARARIEQLQAQIAALKAALDQREATLAALDALETQ